MQSFLDFIFVAHLSYCGQWLSVVRRASSVNIWFYTLEATFATRVWCNFVSMFVLTISKSSSDMGGVGSNFRSPGQVYTLEARFATRFWWSLITMFVLAISCELLWLVVVRRMSSSVVRRASSVSIWFVHSKGHICDLIWMKHRHVWFDNISAKFEYGSCRVKNYFTTSNVKKTSLHSRGYTWIMSPIVGSKTRSPGQIFGNSCLHSRGHICDPILMKHDQNVCLDNV